MSLIREFVEEKIVEVQPKPIFVIKGKLFSRFRDFDSGSKIFVNLCYSDLVPSNKEDTEFSYDIFNKILNNEWDIPLLNSDLREVKDKKGVRSLVLECIINSKYKNWVLKNAELKEILIQWCFDLIEFKFDLIIDRDFIKFPKREYMGDEIPDLKINLRDIERDSDELKELSKDLFNEQDPMNLIRKDEEDVPSLLPEPPVKKEGLIVEIDEIPQKAPVAQNTKEIKFSIEMNTIDTTVDGFTSEIKIRGPKGFEIPVDAVSLNINVEDRMLIISFKGEVKNEIGLPIKEMTSFRSFYVRNENVIYLYIK